MKTKTISRSAPFVAVKHLPHWQSLSGLVLGLVLAIGSSSSFAHQQKTAVTRVLFNPNTHNIEVMHRFFVHDAEHAASVVFGQAQMLMESQDSRELFSSYVMNRFSVAATLLDGSSVDLKLDYVGVELDGQYLWVYQETSQQLEIASLTIVNAALRDVWPDQANLVNVERAGKVYSLSFNNADDMLSVSL